MAGPSPAQRELSGRKTHDKGIEMGMGTRMKGAGFGPQIKNYAFSRQPRTPHQSAVGFVFVTEPVKIFAQRLRAQPGKGVWMMGGGGIIASFLDEGKLTNLLSA